MKKLILVLTVCFFTSSAFAGSCPMLAGKVESKIEAAKKLHEEGVKAHSNGDHAKSEELLQKALTLLNN